MGKVLFDSINWISHPKISPDGKRVAFADHENPSGDDQGAVAVIEPDGNEKKLSTGWSSVEGILWSPAGDEIWFTASDSGSAANLRGVTLAGKVRTIINVPGGMWLQDARGGMTLMITHQARLGIRALPPGGKDEVELGWFGWSLPRDISRDGKKVLFEEEAEGGGPNYTVFLRDTDGSPPVRIGEGTGEAISPDNKWVITKPAKGGATQPGSNRRRRGPAVDPRQHKLRAVRYLPDGKQLLASGIEAGHGVRDYLIDLSNGNAKPITPEGTAGVRLSPDGRSVAVIGPDGKWGIWPLDGSGLRPVPGLDSKYYVSDWSPDGTSLYALSSQRREGAAKVYRVNVTTGKMEFWKTFGENLPAGVASVGGPRFSSDGSAYAYVYSQSTVAGVRGEGIEVRIPSSEGARPSVTVLEGNASSLRAKNLSSPTGSKNLRRSGMILRTWRAPCVFSLRVESRRRAHPFHIAIVVHAHHQSAAHADDGHHRQQFIQPDVHDAHFQLCCRRRAFPPPARNSCAPEECIANAFPWGWLPGPQA